MPPAALPAVFLGFALRWQNVKYDERRKNIIKFKDAGLLPTSQMPGEVTGHRGQMIHLLPIVAMIHL